MTRGSPKRSARVLRPSASTEGCAIRSKAGLARTVPWPARSVSSMRRLQARARACSSARLGRRALQPRSPGSVDDGLDPHRPAVFEVLLDPGVLAEHVEHYAAGVGADGWSFHGSAEGAAGVAPDVPAEDDLDAGGTRQLNAALHRIAMTQGRCHPHRQGDDGTPPQQRRRRTGSTLDLQAPPLRRRLRSVTNGPAQYRPASRCLTEGLGIGQGSASVSRAQRLM